MDLFLKHFWRFKYSIYWFLILFEYLVETFKSPKFKPRTSTAAKLGKYAFGAYIASQIFGGGKGPGIFPPKDNRPEIKAGEGGDIRFTLAGKPKVK